MNLIDQIFYYLFFAFLMLGLDSFSQNVDQNDSNFTRLKDCIAKNEDCRVQFVYITREGHSITKTVKFNDEKLIIKTNYKNDPYAPKCWRIRNRVKKDVQWSLGIDSWKSL